MLLCALSGVCTFFTSYSLGTAPSRTSYELGTRASVVLDLCPFGGRKCACAGGVGEGGGGGGSSGREEEGRVGGERKRKIT